MLPWIRHLGGSRALCQRAFQACLDSGDVAYAAYSGFVAITARLGEGASLEDLQREAERAAGFARRAQFDACADYVDIQLALIRTLRGLTPKFGVFEAEAEEEGGFERNPGEKVRIAQKPTWYFIAKLQPRFHAGEIAHALAASSRAPELSFPLPHRFAFPQYHF